MTLYQGPLPMRSLALTPPGPEVERNAFQVLPVGAVAVGSGEAAEVGPLARAHAGDEEAGLGIGRGAVLGQDAASGAYTDTVTATVLGVNPERFRLSNGQVVFQRPGMPLYPAELVLIDPTLSVALRSARSWPSER